MELSREEKIEFFKALARNAKKIKIPREVMEKVANEAAGFRRLEEIINKVYLIMEEYKVLTPVISTIIERTIKEREKELFSKPKVRKEEVIQVNPEQVLYGPAPVPKTTVVRVNPEQVLYGPAPMYEEELDDMFKTEDSSKGSNGKKK